jgi:hypothetical protein
LRKILKNRAHDEIDFYIEKNLDKVKEIKNNIDDKNSIALHKLGPPSFMKKKFRLETMNMFKSVSGKFFGC